MIDLLNAIADFFLSVLKGILSFFRELIPLLLKVAFVLSPFVLVIFTAYFVGGFFMAAIALIGLLVFISVGVLWAQRNNLKGSNLTPGVIASVLIMDLILISLIVTEPYWKGLLRSQSANQETIRGSSEVSNEGKGLTSIPDVKSSPNAERTLMTGKWVGKLNDSSSTLNISEQNGSSFKGTLTKYDPSTYIIAITGSLNPSTRQISIIETQVIREPSSGAWSLGVNEGTVSSDGRSMSGTGKDQRGNTYSWSFSKS